MTNSPDRYKLIAIVPEDAAIVRFFSMKNEAEQEARRIILLGGTAVIIDTHEGKSE